MQPTDSQQIVRRFFECIEMLKEMRVIRGISLSFSSIPVRRKSKSRCVPWSNRNRRQ